MVIQGVFLFACGPYLASWISPNLMEQASIWYFHAVSGYFACAQLQCLDGCVFVVVTLRTHRCFFSIAQISVMLFFIRETLIIHWGRAGHRESLLAKRGATSVDSGRGGASGAKKAR